MIKVVTDTTCDLPEEILTRYDISCIPLNVHMDGVVYQDGVDLHHDEFYKRLPQCKVLPKTSPPDVETFLKTYRILTLAGATHILSIHISEYLSETVKHARMAASQLQGSQVTVLDSGQISLGTGFIVREAARLAEAGLMIDEIIDRLKVFSKRVHAMAAVDDLQYSMSSNRIGRLLAGLGTIFDIKPILIMNDGKYSIERVRTYTRAISRLIELTVDLESLEEYAVLYSSNITPAKKLIYQAAGLFPAAEQARFVQTNSIIGAHLGLGAVGLACIRRQAS